MSKKLENLEAAVALHFMWYNFGRVHQALRVTPPMEAGVPDHVWTLAENRGAAGLGRLAAVKSSVKRPIGCLLVVWGLAALATNGPWMFTSRANRTTAEVSGTVIASIVLVAIVILGLRLVRAQDGGSKPN